MQGMLVAAAQPMNLFLRSDRRDARHSRRRSAGHRPGADRGAASACNLPAGSGRLADHVCRHLLRRHVWRLDDLDPSQYTRRKRLDRHRAGRATRWPARDAAVRRWQRLPSVRSSPGLIATLGLAFIGAFRRQAGAGLWSARIFRANGTGLRHRVVRFSAIRRCAGSPRCSSALRLPLSASTS